VSLQSYRGHPTLRAKELSRTPNASGTRNPHRSDTHRSSPTAHPSRTPIARRQPRTHRGHPPISPTADTHLSEKSYTSPGFFPQTIFVSSAMISS
jgi:hypothetical protein